MLEDDVGVDVHGYQFPLYHSSVRFDSEEMRRALEYEGLTEEDKDRMMLERNERMEENNTKVEQRLKPELDAYYYKTVGIIVGLSVALTAYQWNRRQKIKKERIQDVELGLT